MSEFSIRPADVFEIVQRQRRVIAAAFAGTFLFVMCAFAVLPRTYQTEATVHIGVNYFQNPLIGDLVSQTHDPGELRSERERIIKTSLGVEFANRMDEKYGLFRAGKDDPARATEIEWFLKSLDISPVTTTQFNIKYKGRTAKRSYGVVMDAIETVRAYLFQNRVRMLEEFLGVLQDEIANTGADGGGRASAPTQVGSRSEGEKVQMASQISALEQRLEQLRQTYNDSHPSVQAARTEIAELRSMEQAGGLAPRLTRRKIFQKGGASGLGVMTIKDDLTKQRHLVNISLEMEKKDPSMTSYLSLVKEPVEPKSPFFPKLRMFLLLALVAGVMAATLATAVLEFWQHTRVSPRSISDRLKIDLLGDMALPNESA